MDLFATLLIAWAVTAPLNYVIIRRDHVATFGKWTRIDRLVSLGLAFISGPWGLFAIGIVALFTRVSATAWANHEARW